MHTDLLYTLTTVYLVVGVSRHEKSSELDELTFFSHISFSNHGLNYNIDEFLMVWR